MLFVFSSLSLSYPSHSRTRRGVYLPRWSEEEKNCPYGGLSAGWCEFHRCGTPIGVVLAMKRNLTKNGHPRPWDPSHEAGFPRFFQEENKWEFPIDPIAPPRPWRTGWSEEEKNCPYSGLTGAHHPFGTPIGWLIMRRRNLTKNGFPRFFQEERYLRPTNVVCRPDRFGQPVCDIHEENKWEIPFDPTRGSKPWRIGWSEEEKNCPSGEIAYGWGEAHGFIPRPHPRVIKRIPRTTNVECWPDEYGMPMCRPNEENKWEIPFDPTRGSKPWRIGWSEEEKNCPSGEIAYGWGEAHGFIPRPHPRVIKRIPRTTNVECWPDEYGMPMCRPNEENKWEIPFDPTRGSKPWRIGWSEEEKNCPSGEIAYGWGEAHGFIPRPHPRVIKRIPRTTNVECWPDEYGMPMCRPNEENKWEIPFDPTRGSKPWRIGWSEEEKNCPSGEIAYGWGEAHGFIPRPHPHIIRLRPRTTNLLEPIR